MERTAAWGSARSVGYVLGALGAEAAPGTVLVRLLADLGVREQAARTTLSRMTRAGQLAAERHGRVAVYRPVGAYREQFLRVRNAAAPPVWTGAFDTVLYDIEESHRQVRDELRIKAFAAGFGSPRPGLLVGFVDPARWLPELGGVGWVASAKLHCDLATARDLVARGWPLVQLAAVITAVGTGMTRVRSAEPTTDRSAFRAHHEATATFAGAQIEVPALPAELAPTDWPLPELSRTYAEVDRRLWPAAERYVQAVRDASPEADLVRPLPGPHPHVVSSGRRVARVESRE